MTVLRWVRHAESLGNVADVEAQRAGAARLELSHRDPDMPLSDLGHEQAAALGRAWRGEPPPYVVLSSPYERAYRTAVVAVEHAGWDLEVRRDERLRERDLGVLDGWTRTGIEEKFPEEAQRRQWLGKFYYRPPGGESWADVAGRVRAVLADERAWRPPDHDPDRTVVLVSHQALILLARYVLEGLTETEVLDVDRQARMPNTAVTSYDGTADGWQLRAAASVEHLEDVTTPVTHEQEPADAQP